MEDNTLQKKMSFWHIWALGVGAVVGDGIFLMAGQGAEVAGPAAVISYLIAGLLLMAVCMVICEMSVGMPGAGSLFTWSKRVLGPQWGILASFGELLMHVIFLGSVSLAAGNISNYFFVIGSNETVSAVIWAILLLTVIFVIALAGGEITGRAQLILVIVLVGIMAIFAVGGIVSGHIDLDNYKPFAPFGGKGIWLAIGMGAYSYMGPLALVTASGEIKKVTDMPKAMFWAFVTFLILYTAAIAVTFGLQNYQDYASMASPFTSAAEFVFGRYAGLVINFAAWIAVVTCLVGEIFCASRLLYGMAEDNTVPKVFGKLNKKGSPYVGLIAAYIVGVLLIFMGIVGAMADAYTMLANVGTAAGIIGMLVSVTAALRYKTRFPEEWAAMPWHCPGRGLMFVLAYAGIAILLYSLFMDVKVLIWTAILMALLVAFYFGYAKPHYEKANK